MGRSFLFVWILGHLVCFGNCVDGDAVKFEEREKWLKFNSGETP